MTKYPIKHTMVFGDVRCDYCGGTGRKINIPTLDGVCPKCAGEGNIPLSVTFELVKACPECGGLGYDDDLRDKDYLDSESCPNCSDNGLPDGKIHRYWAMQEATEEMGEGWEWPADTVIWLLTLDYDNNPIWEPAPYIGLIHEAGRLGSVLAFPLQPAPPADYRP